MAQISSPLAALPVEVLDSIAWYASSNASLLLILSGSKVLGSKLRRATRLSLEWTNFAYFSWYDCASFLSRFSQLRTLELTTWSRKLLCRERLEPDLLPSSLTSLTLDFYDALASLLLPHGTMKDMTAKLTSLTHLSVTQYSAPTRSQLDFASFPATLKSLRLIAGFIADNNVTFWVNEHQLWSLPPHLESLTLYGLLIRTPSPQDAILFGFNSDTQQPHLPSLTSLSLISNEYNIDLKYIAAQLRYLKLLNASRVLFDSKLLFAFPPAYPESEIILRPSIFPKLEFLSTDSFVFDWLHLYALPPTLTALVPRFSPAFSTFVQPAEKIAILNREHDATPPAHALPRNLRKLGSLDTEWNSKIDIHLGQEMPLLRELPQLHLVKDIHSVGKWLSTLYLEKLHSSEFGLLPPALTSLTLNRLLMDPLEAMECDDSALLRLPSLKYFRLSYALQTPMLEYLPHSLEELDVLVSNSVLKRLKLLIDNETGDVSAKSSSALSSPQNVSNSGVSAFKALRKLTLRYLSENSYDNSRLELSLDTIPKNITSLHALALIVFSTSHSKSLRHHQHLKELVTSEHLAVDPMELLPEIPPQLLVLDVMAFPKLDLNEYTNALVLYNFGQRVKGLKVLDIGNSKRYVPGEWIQYVSETGEDAPFVKHPLTFKKWLQLPTSLKVLYFCQYLNLPTSTLDHVSQWFASSCLPRGLSEFSMNGEIYIQPGFNFIGFDLVSWVYNYWYYLAIPTIKYQLPLIGLVGTLPGFSKSFEALNAREYDWIVATRSLPPQLSGGTYKFTHVIPHLFYKQTRQNIVDIPVTPRVVAQNRPEWHSPLESFYHLSNSLTGLILAFTLRSSLSHHPWLSYYLWSSIIGSALAFPISTFRWLRSRGHSRNPTTLANDRFLLAFILLSITNLVVNTSLFFPIARNFSTSATIALGGFSTLMALGRNIWLQVLRK